MSAAQEAHRQQSLLQALLRDTSAGGLLQATRDGPHSLRGLQAYQAHAAALAERALAAAYPTLQMLLGPDAFAALARAFWRHSPPVCGDITQWGLNLPAFAAAAADLAEVPYVADVARLDWAVHAAATAADSTPAALGLQDLAGEDPALCRLVPLAGTALVESAFPVCSIWQAHKALPALDAPADEPFANAREALAQGRAEAALVWRQGWRVRVAPLGPNDACFTRLVLAGCSLGAALQQATAAGSFDFQAWLLAQLSRGWLVGAERVG